MKYFLKTDKELVKTLEVSSAFYIGADAWWVLANDHDSTTGNRFTVADSWYGNLRYDTNVY